MYVSVSTKWLKNFTGHDDDMSEGGSISLDNDDNDSI